MKKTPFIFFTLAIFFLSNCSSDKKQGTEAPVQETTTEVVTPGDTIYISDNYPEFPSAEITFILDSMHFCGLKPEPEIPDSLQLYPCTADLFGIFPNNPENDWRKGFLMEARQGVWAKSSRVFNFEKIDGAFHVINDLKGQLLYMVPQKDNKHDIVLRYYDSRLGTVGVEHKWIGKSYKPVNVIMINDLPVKKEFQDSLNHVYLDNFVWGY